MPIQHQMFKAEDLVKIETPSLNDALTAVVAHSLKTKGDQKKLALIREAIREVDRFICGLMGN